MIIYKLTNKINGKIYIGQTIKSFEERLRGHIYDAQYRKKTSESRLSNAIRKYGIDNFEKEIIYTASSIEELNEKEEFYIKHFNSTNREIGYNIKYGGNNYTMPIETRRKIGNKTKERFYSNQELREKVLNGLKKGIETQKKKSLSYFVEKKCECCGKVMKLKPHLSDKKYCSDECVKLSKNYEKGLTIANEINKERVEKRRNEIIDCTIDFVKNNAQLIREMPFNKIKLQPLIDKLGYKDIRTISKAFGVSGGKELLVELKRISENVC